jgi:hypothetical protein
VPRYVLVPDDSVIVPLTPQEWAVALDALEKVHSDRDNGYSPVSKTSLYRVVRKFAEAANQIPGIDRRNEQN